jgi:hypothetical protein
MTEETAATEPPVTTTSAVLTPRWTVLRPHAVQQRVVRCRKRYMVVPAGRRSGKTELVGKRMIVLRALLSHRRDLPAFFRPYPNPRFGIGAPTRDQAKTIYWDDIKRLIPRDFIRGKPNETELSLYLLNGAEIHVLGMDRAERAEGVPWDYFCLDEFGNMRPNVWEEHVRPSLSDRKGGCAFIGVPEGRNHYYDLWKNALAFEAEEEHTGHPSEWATFHWKSIEILDAAEVNAARAHMDELTFLQEYEGSFISFTGRAYWPFDERTHCKPLEYNPAAPLIFCFDFNVDPGVAAVLQEQRLPNGLDGTGVIGEVYIERASNSQRVATKLAEMWAHHTGTIFCYGDASGGQRGSAKVLGSDWQLIKEILWAHFSVSRVFFRVPLKNPGERERVNAVNSRLKTIDGDVFLMVDPARAPHVVKDFEGVVTVSGGSGELDDSDQKLKHISDAIGYYVAHEFPVRKRYVSSGQRYWK